ncbi:MAG: tetratricopeptide repeat protein, partial [Snowella sp.]|nr:tetratricopeptide repeat protein [Snowella sp.]
MLKPIAEAIDSQQFEVAEQLLKDLPAERRENPWVEFYEARLAEGKGDWSTAKQGYRQLLPSVNNPQLIAKLRQGLDRLAKAEEKQRQQEKAEQHLELEKIKT